MTMSWDAELKFWYPTALKALQFASLRSLGLSPEEYEKLFVQNPMGVSMKCVSILCNNLELRTPEQMGVTAKDWANILRINQSIANAWNATMTPVQLKIHKECEIMDNRPKLVVAEA